jgi:RNA polymerase sigma-70 factor (ECF subfamily)
VSATTNQVFANYQNDFESAISRYSPVLFRVAFRRLRNVEDAEDAVQDALLSAYKHIGQFEGRSKLSTWLTRIVTNVALMKLRRYARHEILPLEQNDEGDCAALASGLKDAGPNPETICARAEMEERLRQALEQLSPKQRSAIQMCELDGFSAREAADALGISTNTLKSRVSRARGNLGALLRDVSGAPPMDDDTPVADRKDADRHTPNYTKLHIERDQNCYPPRSLESAPHTYPQGYAT